MRHLKPLSLILGLALAFCFSAPGLASDTREKQIATPENLRASALTSNSLLVSFDSVRQASSYTIKIYFPSRERVFKTKTIASSASTVMTTTISDLSAHTEYRVSVVAGGIGRYNSSEESEKVKVTTLIAAVVPTIDAPIPTSDGFTVNISNYSPSCNYSQSVSGTTGAISRSTNLITVSGLDPGEFRTITITETCPGSDPGTYSSSGIHALPLIPAFETYTSTTDGFNIQITNFRSDYSWSGTVSGGLVNINSTGLIAVTGLSAGGSTSVHVTTSRTNYFSGASDTNLAYAYASAKTIATTSTIANGGVNPSVVVTGVDFKPGITLADLTVVANSTGLSCATVTYNSSVQITVACTGTAAAGTLSVTAYPSAFTINPASVSNSLSITVPPSITPATSGDSTLSGLLVSGISGPNFFWASTNFNVLVPSNVSTITFTPTLSDPTGFVTINGTITGSGVTSGPISIARKTVVKIIVTATDNSTTTYTVNIYQGPPFFFFLTTNNNTNEIVANRSVPVEGYKIISNAVEASSYSIDKALPTGLIFDTSTGMISGTPSVNQVRNFWTVTLHNAIGPDYTALFYLTVKGVSCDGSVSICQVGDRGPGNGIIYYVAPTPFASPGSTCNTNGLGGISTCKYLEYAPAGWLLNDSVPAADSKLSWSVNVNTLTGQNFNLTTIQSGFLHETNDWAIGAGFNNSILIANQAGAGDAATNAAIAALSYAASDGSVGKWFLPSANELNELCKYANGYTTGVLTQLCQGGSINNQLQDLGGFIYDLYWSSSETNNQYESVAQDFYGFNNQFLRPKTDAYLVRPIRVF